jgi:hydrogenase nickel incorporation protein HypB
MKNILVVENILNANDKIAAENRALLDAAGIFSINIMASPGAGKTSLIEKTILMLKERINIAVIDGDIATSFDTDRAAACGAQAIQINTGGECHLDANMVYTALQKLNLENFDLLIIENVGNLVCPASFKLGSHLDILIASIPEGDDKPYKYPGMFSGISILILNKIDLLPYVDFNLLRFYDGVEILNPGVSTFALSCRTGEGLLEWTDWLGEQVSRYKRERIEISVSNESNH